MKRMMKNSLTNYLNKYCLLKLTYLPVQSAWYYAFIRTSVLILLIVITIKGIVLMIFKFDHSTALAWGDYAVNWLKPHQFLLGINNLWFFCGWCAVTLLQRTNVSPKKQFWFHSLSILDEYIYDWTKETKSIIIYLFFSVLKSNLFLGAAFSWCLYIPVLIESESIFQFFHLNLAALNAAIAGFCCTAFCVNFSFIFAFYSLNSGFKYHKLASRLSRQVSRPSSSSTINKMNRDLIELLIENYKSNSFWTQMNSTVFLGTFLAQIPILYLIFFVPLTNFIKFSMVILGALNFLCGQSITFLSGSFAKAKFDECRKQLNLILINRDDLRLYHRIKLLCSADYLINHQLFYIFGHFEFTRVNYLLVILEIISHLLLLIANAGIN
uniref:Gustatory receptor n=1 Tax=Tetranychus urticae TaxID=32264 RepID=T1L0Y9_TETUR